MTGNTMLTPLRRESTLDPNYIPHYSNTQQIIGIAVLATIIVVMVVAFIIVQHRRGR